MNELFSTPPPRPTTQAADGLPRWRWTAAEIERMAAAGIFHEDERFELLGGEIVPISPKGRRHEIIRTELAIHFSRLAPGGVFVASEPQFNLGPDTYVMPDLLVHPRAIAVPDARGSDALPVVEVADTSLTYDVKAKMPLYAFHGVREYWVINAVTLMTTVYREPAGSTYRSVQEFPPDAAIAPSLVPALTVSLGAIALD
jgi:Uma2 family endonuclease